MHSHEDLLTAFLLSADLLLRSRLYALAGHNVQQKRNTLGEAVNRRSPKNAFSEAASIFGLRLPLRGLKGASSPFLATATTAACGGYREELLGQRPAGCKRQRSRRWEPQPGLGASAPERDPLSALRGIDGGVCFQCKVIAVAVALLVRPCKGYGFQ